MSTQGGNFALMHGLALGAFMLAAMPSFHAGAQDLGGSAASAETIVGSEIATDKAEPDSVVDDVVAAIEKSSDAANEVRKLFRVDDFHIVYLGARDTGEGMERIHAALEDNADATKELREAIEGSSVFYTALDTNNLEVENVVAAAITEDKAVTAYVFGEAP